MVAIDTLTLQLPKPPGFPIAAPPIISCLPLNAVFPLILPAVRPV